MGRLQQLTHLEVPTAHIPAAQFICKQKRDLLSNNKHSLNTTMCNALFWAHSG